MKIYTCVVPLACFFRKSFLNVVFIPIVLQDQHPSPSLAFALRRVSSVHPSIVYPNSGFPFVFHLQASSSGSLVGFRLFSKVLFSVSEIWKTESRGVLTVLDLMEVERQWEEMKFYISATGIKKVTISNPGGGNGKGGGGCAVARRFSGRTLLLLLLVLAIVLPFVFVWFAFLVLESASGCDSPLGTILPSHSFK